MFRLLTICSFRNFVDETPLVELEAPIEQEVKVEVLELDAPVVEPSVPEVKLASVAGDEALFIAAEQQPQQQQPEVQPVSILKESSSPTPEQNVIVVDHSA